MTNEYVIPAYRPVVVGAAEEPVVESVAAECDSSRDTAASVDRTRARKQERWRKPKKVKAKMRSAQGGLGSEADGDDSRRSVVSALSNRSGHSYGGVTPMSQRSAGSLARHQANEAVKAEIALLRAALEATQSAGESARKVAALEERDRQQAAELSEQAALAAAREEESARKVAALGMGVPDGVI